MKKSIWYLVRRKQLALTYQRKQAVADVCHFQTLMLPPARQVEKQVVSKYWILGTRDKATYLVVREPFTKGSLLAFIEHNIVRYTISQARASAINSAVN